MRLSELIKSVNSKPELTPQLWEKFKLLKQNALTTADRLIKGQQQYQLFVPRGIQSMSKQEKRLYNLGRELRWDDDGNLDQESQDWEDNKGIDIHPSGKEIEEAAPILSPSRGGQKGDWNKPTSILWTSTGTKNDNGEWSSDWTRTNILSSYKVRKYEWNADYGYLYKIKPNAGIIEINDVQDAEYIAYILGEIGKHEYLDDGGVDRGTKNFPWEVVGLHFDGVYFNGGGLATDRDTWSSSWEVESIAWLSSTHLQLLGKVPIDRTDPFDWD